MKLFKNPTIKNNNNHITLKCSTVPALKQAPCLVALEGHILIKQSAKSIDSIFSVFWGAAINKTLTEYNGFYSLY